MRVLSTWRRPSTARAEAAAPDTADIDTAWELEPADVVLIEDEDAPESAEHTRATMPTLHEDDPLSHDIAYRRERAARDSMPTFPEIDPLSYDLPDEG